MPDVANRAGFECFAVHDCSIHFVDSGGGKDRAFAGVEIGIVLEGAHRRFSRVQARTAMLQNFPTGSERIFDSGAVFVFALRRHLAALHRSGATVNNQSNFIFFH